MRIFILTSATGGFASIALTRILEQKAAEIAAVIHSRDLITDKKKHYKKKLKKVFKIGVLGAINGYLMRKWFSDECKYLPGAKSLREICSENNIPYLEVKNTASPDPEDLGQIKSLCCDLGISLGSSYISPSIFTIPKKGMINIHHELLPEYKGAQSIIWQLHNNSSEMGYTIHKISKGIDAGEILYRKEMNINFRDTLRDTIEYNCALLKADSIESLCKLLLMPQLPENHPPNVGVPRNYTTPTFREMQRIRSNFKRLKKK